jgi:predicted SprT family Zn-dependent metalloprotease
MLDVALCHEVAHLLAFRLVGNAERKHGPTWQRLMREAGHEPSTRLVTPTGGSGTRQDVGHRRYRHRCPTCQFVRTAPRPVPGWRCADCVGAGLDGRLLIESVGRIR